MCVGGGGTQRDKFEKHVIIAECVGKVRRTINYAGNSRTMGERGKEVLAPTVPTARS